MNLLLEALSIPGLHALVSLPQSGATSFGKHVQRKYLNEVEYIDLDLYGPQSDVNSLIQHSVKEIIIIDNSHNLDTKSVEALKKTTKSLWLIGRITKMKLGDDDYREKIPHSLKGISLQLSLLKEKDRIRLIDYVDKKEICEFRIGQLIKESYLYLT